MCYRDWSVGNGCDQAVEREIKEGEVVRGEEVVVLLTKWQQLEFACWLIP